MRSPREFPEFRDWFGESKIVERDGTPKIAYHGTVRDFTAFEHKKARRRAFGFHFGSLTQAEWFAQCYGPEPPTTGSNMRPVYLRITKPLRMPDVFVRGGRESADKVVEWLIINGVVAKPEGARAVGARSIRELHERVVQLIEAAGYDGIVYENEHEIGRAHV